MVGKLRFAYALRLALSRVAQFGPRLDALRLDALRLDALRLRVPGRVRVRQEHDVPATALGIIQRVVGPFGNRLRRGAFLREGDAEADRHRAGGAVRGLESRIDDAERFHRAADALRDGPGEVGR